MSQTDDSRPYTLITADSHAGASLEGYRAYLDAEHQRLFDDWRGGYRNPQLQHIGSKKHKNWDDAERMRDMEGEGVVGEIVFPNTVPPFFKTSVLICGNPSRENYPLRLEGIRAHNRWLVDWCGEHAERRAGIGLVYLNDIDEAIADVRWIAEHGLRGGILLPHVPPDCTHILPLYAPEYDRFWAVCQDLDVVVNQHGGTGSPDYGPYPVAMPIRLLETGWFSTRSYAHLLMSGVFERFPKLRYIVTESGCAWVPATLAEPRLDLEPRAHRRGRRVRVREGLDAARAAELLRAAQLLLRRERALAARARGAPRDRRRAPLLGQRLPALRGHLPAHARVAAPHLRTTLPARRGARHPRRERRARSTASTSRSWPRSQRASARRPTRSRSRSRPKRSRRTSTPTRSASRARASSPGVGGWSPLQVSRFRRGETGARSGRSRLVRCSAPHPLPPAPAERHISVGP